MEEIEVLGKEIQTKCGEELEARIHRLRKTRINPNVPEEINTTNVEGTIIIQNPKLNLAEGSMIVKFSFHTKRNNRNEVLEVCADTR